MVKNLPKWWKNGRNGGKMAKKVEKLPKLSKKNGQNGGKLAKVVEDWPNWQKMAEIAKKLLKLQKII